MKENLWFVKESVGSIENSQSMQRESLKCWKKLKFIKNHWNIPGTVAPSGRHSRIPGMGRGGQIGPIFMDY